MKSEKTNNGFVFTNDNIQFKKRNIPEEIVYNDKNFQDLIEHNMDISIARPNEMNSLHTIEKFGKHNLLEKNLINFAFFVESKNFNLENLNSEGISIKSSVCSKDKLGKNCLINNLFDKGNKKKKI